MQKNVYFRLNAIGTGETIRQEEVIQDNQQIKKWIRLSHHWLDDVTPVAFLFEPFDAIPEIGFRVYSSRPRSSENSQQRAIDGIRLAPESLLFDSDASRAGRRIFSLVNDASHGGFLVRSEAGVDLAIETLVVIEDKLLLNRHHATSAHRPVSSF